MGQAASFAGVQCALHQEYYALHNSMIKALLVLGRLRESGKKCLLPISASPSSSAATSSWGGWCAQASPPKGTSSSKYPRPYGGGSLCTLGMIQLLLLPSSRLHFIFAVSLNPTCSCPASDFKEGQIAQYRGPRSGRTRPFLPPSL